MRFLAEYSFSYSLDGTFTPPGGNLTARPGCWVGAQIGVFASAAPHATRAGHADVSRFLVAPSDVR